MPTGTMRILDGGTLEHSDGQPSDLRQVDTNLDPYAAQRFLERKGIYARVITIELCAVYEESLHEANEVLAARTEMHKKREAT